MVRGEAPVRAGLARGHPFFVRILETTSLLFFTLWSFFGDKCDEGMTRCSGAQASSRLTQLLGISIALSRDLVSGCSGKKSRLVMKSNFGGLGYSLKGVFTPIFLFDSYCTGCKAALVLLGYGNLS